MTQPDQPPRRRHSDLLRGRIERRQQRIRAQVRRDREGGHTVPTWVLAAILGLLLAGWAWLLLTT